VLDLGCGAGAWLLMLLEEHPDVTADGVDTSAVALQRARKAAVARGLAERVTWHLADAGTWPGGGYDAVLCIGASHIHGGFEATLRAIRGHIRPRRTGHAIVGDGFWELPPSEAAQAALEAGPDDFPSLPELIALAEASEWEPTFGHVSSADEWDAYEWSWTGSLARWALDRAIDPATRGDAALALQEARSHRERWLAGYRGELGFVTVLLTDTAELG
jgi:SAM-dependent methyltransferase